MKVIAKYVEAVKAHGMKPLTFATETLKCEIGAEIPHDFMLDGDEFTNAYKERSVFNG